MTKRKKKFSKADVQGLNGRIPGIRYPADQERAQIRGGKRSFAKKLISNTKPTKSSELSEGGI